MTLDHSGVVGLLAVGGDAKAKVKWPDTSAKTRGLFTELAANLTAIEHDATLEP